MKSQITLLALGGNAGSCGALCAGRAWAMPSSKSMAPSTAPVNPMPMSLRNCRRPTGRPRPAGGRRPGLMLNLLSADRDEVVVIQEDMDERFSGPPAGVGGG